jgi:hypothetical protein
MLEERRAGRTYVAIAERYGISASRARVICEREARLRAASPGDFAAGSVQSSP